MKLVIVTFYFPPDLSAGSFRMAALVEALLRKLGPDDTLDVITTSPNRYANMEIAEGNAPMDPRLTVHRVEVPAHQSGMADQARTFMAFEKGARAVMKSLSPDLLIATSSRLMTAWLGARLARSKRVPLYLDIRDIFTETMGDVFAGSMLRHALPLFEWIERQALKSARRINVVSPAFIDYFRPVVGHDDIATFTNGVDPLFKGLPERSPDSGRPLVMAAGNMGEGQGLHHIVPELARALPLVDFELIGGGGRRDALARRLAEEDISNVTLREPVKRERLPQEYARADILFMHLNDLAAFRRVLPSKMFEYAATGRPVLAGVGGYARQFVDQHVTGAQTFAPCNVEEAKQALQALLAGPRSFDRSAFVEQFARASIMDRMAQDIIDQL